MHMWHTHTHTHTHTFINIYIHTVRAHKHSRNTYHHQLNGIKQTYIINHVCPSLSAHTCKYSSTFIAIVNGIKIFLYSKNLYMCITHQPLATDRESDIISKVTYIKVLCKTLPTRKITEQVHMGINPPRSLLVMLNKVSICSSLRF